MSMHITKKVVGAITFLMLLYQLFSALTWLYRGNDVEAREDIVGFRNQGNVDVVFYGASNLLRYYQPLVAWKEKGYTSYNYATSAGQPDNLKDFIAESRNWNEASLYVCDIRAFGLLTDELHDSFLRNWSDSLPIFSLERWRGINTFLKSRDISNVSVPPFYFDIMKYHSNTDAIQNAYQWNYLCLDNIYSLDKGFDADTGHIPFDKPEVVNDIGELTEQQYSAITELLDYCDKEKINVLFICNPIIISEDTGRTINAIGEIISKRGYPFVNFNNFYDEIGLDFKTDFYDVNHVNYLGAEKYTTYLMEYISDNYDLPDHRGDPQYEMWDKDYKQFVEMQSNWKETTIDAVNDHLSAKSIREDLQKETDFYAWLSDIKNPNFTVVFRISNKLDSISTNSHISNLFNDYDIDDFSNSYCGVWVGHSPILTKKNDKNCEVSIGVDGGRGSDVCRISVDTGINIGGTDYYADESPIQVVVYDNNYKKVIDNVNVVFNKDDSVVIVRP